VWSQRLGGNTTNPTAGDITLLGIADAPGSTIALLAEDDPAALWSAFKTMTNEGASPLPSPSPPTNRRADALKLNSNPGPNGGAAPLPSTNDGATVSNGGMLPKVAAHGAVAVTAPVPPGSNVTLTIVFAWHFPNRDFSHQVLGNMYTELWPSSTAVATELGTSARLTQVVTDINTHHQAIAHPSNPTPVWLKDMLINQWAHFHMLMWYKDGRMREYEAWHGLLVFRRSLPLEECHLDSSLCSA
jgi:hypothetical protein